MAKSFKALYEDGVFKPLGKVPLKNKQKVELTFVEEEESSKRRAKSGPKRVRVRTRTDLSSHPARGIVGLFKSGLHDLSSNHDKYLYSSSAKP